MAAAQHAIITAGILLLSALPGMARETTEVTCGSLIKLVHGTTNHRLHSHEIAYGSGSGQQSVTGFNGEDNANSYWVVRGTQNAPCPQGSGLKKGTHLRLQHHSTRRWLHTHNFKAPLSNNQEVSAFGDDNQSDPSDVWRIDWDGRNTLWTKDQAVRFVHVETGAVLGSHAKQFSRPIAGQTEVAGMKNPGKNGLWTATEGVYFPQKQDNEDDHTEL
eukprot:CAMPEP_0117653880 /NCGR_PEP_ID=MMETSP0804-20121206/3436_1 /TAXON_ID=1074897 /ORGANISM="Tetraselmis astigmatica, Strain CCMP880" /LENGTH=216 /DNA_ID=CAMNT_0005460103 /DNA_START=114 /DNA_END=764 /DNA_ORIENTATION=+